MLQTKKASTKDVETKEVERNEVKEKEQLIEVMALWLARSKNNTEYLNGFMSKKYNNAKIRGFFNGNKKNPKEPDVKIYNLTAEGTLDIEVATLWNNLSKDEKQYLTGYTDDKERLVAFYGDKEDTKHPYIKVYFSK